MEVFYCGKCKHVAAGRNLAKCSKCGGKYIALGVDSSKWNSLSTEQKNRIVKNRVSSNGAASSGTVSASSGGNPSEIWAWMLALTPLLAFFILPRFMFLTFTKASLLCTCLNLIFVGLDFIALKKTGDDGGWMYIGVVLIPVYLFVRAAKTSRNWAPGIVWCISFFLYIFVYIL
jgi:hypothetical protein